MTQPWFLVSKPLRAPWNDGTTVLVRELVKHLPERFALHYFGDPTAPLRAGDAVVALPAMGHQPALGDKIRVLAHLVSPRRKGANLHFFFAPNRVTSNVVRGLQRIGSRRVIHSLPASTGAHAHVNLLCNLDRVVVSSKWGANMLANAGLETERLAVIYPGVNVDGLHRLHAPKSTPRIVYAGDLDETVTDRLVAVASALTQTRFREVTLEILARPKHAHDAAARQRLGEALASQIARGQVLLEGNVPNVLERLARADVQLFLAPNLKGKVDLPLVLLEGLALGVPVLSVDTAPATELFEVARASKLDVGMHVEAEGLPEALSHALDERPLLQRWQENARTLAASAFSSERMGGEYAALYETVTNTK